MSELTRFSVSLKKSLLASFDRHVRELGYPTRSKAIADLIRNSLVKEEWARGKNVSGAIVLVYDHHERELTSRITRAQHNFYEIVVSTQHIHLDHDNCLEIVVVRGKPKDVRVLARKLKTLKGVKYTSLAMATTGKEIA